MEEVNKKRGRPAGSNSRKKQFRLLMTEEEFKNLDRLSRLSGKSKADVVREGLGYVDSISSVRYESRKDSAEEFDMNFDGYFDDDFE